MYTRLLHGRVRFPSKTGVEASNYPVITVCHPKKKNRTSMIGNPYFPTRMCASENKQRIHREMWQRQPSRSHFRPEKLSIPDLGLSRSITIAVATTHSNPRKMKGQHTKNEYHSTKDQKSPINCKHKYLFLSIFQSQSHGHRPKPSIKYYSPHTSMSLS